MSRQWMWHLPSCWRSDRDFQYKVKGNPLVINRDE